MKKYKTHFCMVSQQAAPNLLPLLDDDMKPEQVVLLVTPQMKQQANYLEQVIKPRGIKVVQKPLELIDDFNAMEEQLIGIIDTEPDGEIALNVTGGTKWMAIAAQEVFRMKGAGIFYVKVEDDKVLFLDGDPTSHTLSQHIDLKSYIQAYGYQFREQSQPTGLPPKLRDFCQQLVLKVDSWQAAIGQLNNLASIAESQNSLSVQLARLPHPQDPQLNVLLIECYQAGLLSKKANVEVCFSDEDARTFANGGWLEVYVSSKLNELKRDGVIQDSPRLNQHIQRIGATSHNEIDVCFMARNRLHLIECKTKRMAGKGTADATTDTVYKLDSISDLGGLATKSMLVSYRKLNTADQKRAKDLRIKVIQGTDIRNLKSGLRDWINQ
ncbi:MAG: DUF1887 family CARF protein [Gammaproteobacteria bacterium]|nr:DUF1887 family CARF protein [Gammaproteobacteria bacterium]